MAVSPTKPRSDAPPPHPAEALIDVIIRRAPELIAVGVISLSIDGLSATLAKPAPVAPPPDRGPPPPRQHIDPLRDPSTYPGGKVPGFTRDEDRNGG